MEEGEGGVVVDVWFQHGALGVAQLELAIPSDVDARAYVREALGQEGVFQLQHGAILSAVEEVLKMPVAPRSSSHPQDQGAVETARAQLCDLLASPRGLWRKKEAALGEKTPPKEEGGEDTPQPPQPPPPPQSSQVAFADMFRMVAGQDCHVLDPLVAKEIEYAATVQRMLQQRDEALDALRNKHALKMQHMQEALQHSSEHNAAKLSALVDRQVRELEALEGKWKTRLNETRQTQKRDYRHAVTAQFSSLPPELKYTVGEDSPQDTFAFCALPLVVEPYRHTRTSVWVGSQVKRGYQLWVVESDAVDLLHIPSPPPSPIPAPAPGGAEHTTAHRLRRALDRHLYSSNGLGGWIRVVNTDLMGRRGGLSLEPWEIGVQASTEMHFPPADVQMERLLKDCASRPLATGEFLITRHSNLAFPVNFHIGFDPRDRGEGNICTDPHSRLYKGVYHALNLADDSGVSAVVLPANLLQDASVPVDVNTMASTLVKALKIFMADNSAGEGSLQAFVVAVPSGDGGERFNKVSQLVKQNFGG